MLRVLLEEGPWEGHLSRAGNSKESNAAGSPNPRCLSPPSWPKPLWLHLEATGVETGFFWKFPSYGPFKHRSDNASDTTGNRPETAASATDRAWSLIQKMEKRSRTQSFVQLVDPAPPGTGRVQRDCRWGPKSPEDQDFFPVVIRCGKGTRKCIWTWTVTVQWFLFCLLPSSILFSGRGRKSNL